MLAHPRTTQIHPADQPQTHPRVWILFVSDRWIRAFENLDDGLDLIREFRSCDTSSFLHTAPVGPIERVGLWLEEAVWNNAFDQLILVASSPVQSLFNMTLSPAVLARTIARQSGPVLNKPHTTAETEKLL